MWNKTEEAPKPANKPSASVRSEVEPAPRPKPPVSAPKRGATIGPSISIKGNITGSEDLLIEGRVEGAIELRDNNVTVGCDGRVTADIHGKRICVEGEVKGDLFGDEILIRRSGQVIGNARAPKVTLDNGCHFRGNIDMNPASSAQQARTPARSTPPAAPGSFRDVANGQG